MSADSTTATAAETSGDTVLSTHDLVKRFGGLTAVDAVDMHVDRGEIVGLIGPNGAGKSTLFNCVTGTYEPDAGRVEILGTDVTGWSPHKVAQLGVGRLFQDTRVFGDMTVRKNLLAAGQHERSVLAQFRRPSEETAARADELLGYVDLDGLADVRAGRLSFGQQKLLEFAMALMGEPEILLMDEPAGGINPAMIERMLGYIRETNTEEEVTILLIEHNMDFVMDIADRIYALAHGQRIAVGPPAEIQNDDRVLDAYLGRE
jgi:branched-chain amino acid transport system ATP-binding protein